MNLNSPLKRRDFLHYLFKIILLALVAPVFSCENKVREEPTVIKSKKQNTSETPPPPKKPFPSQKLPDVAIVKGKDFSVITKKAIDEIGGIKAFVKKGDKVIVKPNLCMAGRSPEYAVTTHPLVVATVVKLCYQAGASKVFVFDVPFNGTPIGAYKDSGIYKIARKVGAEFIIPLKRRYARVSFPQGRDIKAWLIYQDVLEADVFINIPIAKHHSLAGLTLGMKNVMGVIKNRSQIHWNIHQRIADLNTVIKSHLTIVDATRILVRHGPTGGSLKDVRHPKTVIASANVVAADSIATTLFKKTWKDIGYIRLGQEMGLGVADLKKLKISRINL